MTTPKYQAEPYLRDLTGFQMRSVEHVVEQLYGEADAKRFLVADETGLGKTRVAQGTIARAIEILQERGEIERIDVVYVCANSDLARQNVRRLNVTGKKDIPFSSRLTLLGEHSRRLEEARHSGGVNLVSFTPGTSFDMGHSLGQARERAMIVLALFADRDLDGWQQRATRVLLQGGVASLKNFDREVDSLRWALSGDPIDETIRSEFSRRLATSIGDKPGLGSTFTRLIAEIGRRPTIPNHLRGEANGLIRGMRNALAAASVHTLEPDLVILDEFQRFRHLLSDGNPAGELAHHLFDFEAAKVLLLSATPYKPYTLAGDEDEDHAKDLFRTLDFLARGRKDVSVSDIRSDLRSFREALLDGRPTDDLTQSLRGQLLKVMSRAERPTLDDGSAMAVEKLRPADDLRAADLADFAVLRRVADVVRQPRDHGLVTAEYWKSAPYFLSFADGYQLGRRLRAAPRTAELAEMLASSHHLRREALESFDEVEPGNARMRVLASETIERDWWKLLWMPPSLAYMKPGGPFAADTVQGMTKRLVFSSWTATPASVASILSYEAERRAVAGSEQYTTYTPEARARVARRLQYTADKEGRPKQMAAMVCHWPLPGLAAETDPLPWVAEHGGAALSLDAVMERAVRAVAERVGSAAGSSLGSAVASDSADRVWRTAFAWDDSWPELTDTQAAAALSGRADEEETDVALEDPADIPNGLSHHLGAARQAHAEPTIASDSDTLRVLAEIGLFSPANIAWRALHRLVRDSEEVTEHGLFEAAAVMANGLRSLFNRPDAIQLVETLVEPPGLPYWRKMLRYIAMGNLEAVLDEHVYQLLADRTSGDATDKLLREVADEVAGALSLRAPNLRALDASSPDVPLTFPARFALRYGGREQDKEDARQPEVRRAFNSPFWPFVLASTSVGQEGIDFHCWSHAVFHWNTPSNPVDFEQREGRVDRYRGHAVRKNVAHAHGRAALAQTEAHPWDDLYERATDQRENLGDFSPGWVYPGPFRIERHIAPIAFSTDLARYERMKRDVALYRLTFGQPRQEDLLQMLRERREDTAELASQRVDLAP